VTASHWRQIASVAGLLLAWQILVQAGRINPLFLPAPLSVLGSMWEMTRSGELPWAVLASLNRVIQGFVYGSAAGVLFLVLVNTMAGVHAINPTLLKAARDLGASRPQIFVKVILPGALPNIFTGLRLGAGMALILVFITEIEATKTGLGFLLWEAFQLMDTRHVFVGVVTFGLLGVATTWLLQWLERVTCPWIQRSN
jgi:ABC-type nitrate/sulfonate/bicarbonate transport system permease component